MQRLISTRQRSKFTAVANELIKAEQSKKTEKKVVFNSDSKTHEEDNDLPFKTIKQDF